MTTVAPNMGASVTSMDAALLSHSVLSQNFGHSTTQEGNGRISSQEALKPRHVDPESMALFNTCDGKMHILRSVPILGGPLECYGPKFMVALSYIYFMVKGMAYTMGSFALYPMLTERYKCDTLEYQRYYTVSRMGWSIKPFTALVSDAVAVFGYKKRWFLVASVIIGGVTSICFSILPEEHSSAMPATILAFLTGYGEANVDILLEGLYSRRMREYPEPGPHLVSVVWAVQMIAAIIASFVQGPLSSDDKAYMGNIIGGALILSCIPLVIINWVGEEVNRVERVKDAIILRREEREERRKNREDHQPAHDDGEAVKASYRGDAEHHSHADEDDELDEDQVEEEYDIPTCCGGAIEFNREVVVRNYRITAICIIMSAIVVATAFITTFHDGYTLLVTGLVGSTLITIQMFWALPFVVAKTGLFSFINQALYIAITSPLNGFYLENPPCRGQDYPQFSYFFFNTISGVIGNTAGLLGVVGFAFIFSKQSYRVTIIITIIAQVVGSIFDLILVERWNIDIGIPDHVMYIFGDAVVYQVAYMLGWMPLVILMSKLCPRGSEAMVYALLAAFSNFGQTVSGIIGTLLMQWAWPVTASECDFGNLWKLIVLGHFITPLCIIPFVFLLIPGARICDDIDSDGNTIYPEAVRRVDETGSSKQPKQREQIPVEDEDILNFEPVPLSTP